jgi:hypothetical protein
MSFAFLRRRGDSMRIRYVWTAVISFVLVAASASAQDKSGVFTLMVRGTKYANYVALKADLDGAAAASPFFAKLSALKVVPSVPNNIQGKTIYQVFKGMCGGPHKGTGETEGGTEHVVLKRLKMDVNVTDMSPNSILITLFVTKSADRTELIEDVIKGIRESGSSKAEVLEGEEGAREIVAWMLEGGD